MTLNDELRLASLERFVYATKLAVKSMRNESNKTELEIAQLDKNSPIYDWNLGFIKGKDHGFDHAARWMESSIKIWLGDE